MNNRLLHRHGIWFLLLFSALAPGLFAAAPTLILHHGKIVTCDSAFSVHPAMAVEGERILKTGTDAEMLALKGDGTKIMDLQGKMVLPGLIDSHVHPPNASMTEFDHAIPDMETIGDVLDYFRARARVLPEGEWIMLQQVFITRLEEQRYPTRAELDAAAPRHAVVFRTGPDASLNSLALKLAGIDRNYKIPAGVAGLVEKDEAGEPNGILRAFRGYVNLPDKARMASTTKEQRVKRLGELLRDYNAAGLTTICDRDTSPEAIGFYQELKQRGELSVRVNLSHSINSGGEISNAVASIKKVAELPLYRERDDWLRLVAVKIYLDGGMLTGSAYMLDPWGLSKIYAITDPAYRGTLLTPPEKLAPLIRAAVECGLQFTAHSVGDGAVQTLLQAYETVNREIPIQAARPCISHANFISRESLQMMKRLGVAVDVQPVWLYLDARTLYQHFGNERLRSFQPWRSVFDLGGMAGGGSDHMQKIGINRSINPYNPFLGMATAITRRAKWFSGQLHPEETLTREQALRLFTTNNAWILFHENKIGSLEAGKLADFVVIDRDFLQCPPDEIAQIQAQQTFVGGRQVYAR